MKLILKNKYQYGGTMGGGTYSVPISTPVARQRAVDVTAAPVHTYVKPLPQANRSGFEINEDLLKAKGLSGETAAYLNQIKQAKSIIDGLNDLDIITQTDKFKQAAGAFRQLTSEAVLNTLRRNEDDYNDAKTKLGEHKGESAVVTYNGNIKVKDLKTGAYKYVTPEDYAKNIESYQPLLGAKALQLRNEKDIFNNDNTLASLSTYGLEYITNRLNSGFQKNIGTSGYKEDKETIESLKEYGGINAIVGEGGFWKNNRKQIDNAIKSAKQLLNKDQWAQLQARAAELAARYGVKLDTPQKLDDGATLILSQNFEGLRVSDGGKTYDLGVSASALNGSGSSGKTPLGPWEHQMFSYGTSTPVSFMDGKIQITSAGDITPKLFDKGHRVGMEDGAPLKHVGLFQDSKLMDAVDLTRIQTAKGDIPVDHRDLQSNMIIHEKSAYFANAYATGDGTFTVDPNNSQLKEFRRIQKEIADKAGLNEQQKTQFLKNEMKRLNIQRVIAFEGEVNIDKNRNLRNAFDLLGDEYKEEATGEHKNKLERIYESGTNMSAEYWYGDDDFMKTVFIAPVSDIGMTRLTLDDTPVNLPGGSESIQSIMNRNLSAGQRQLSYDEGIIKTNANSW